MTWDTRNFDSYRVFYNSESESAEALIQCFNGAQIVGQIMFYKDGSKHPLNKTKNGIIGLYYPISRFNDIITILRYEKPLHLAFETDSRRGHIGTITSEPTGEEET